MKNQLGYIRWVVVILISIIAVGLVGAAWYYESNKEVKKNNSNRSTNLNSNTNLAKETPSEICKRLNYMKVNDEIIPFTIADPFDRGVTSYMEIKNDRFNIATSRAEGGLFELVGFSPNKLHEVGIHSGDEFDLQLLSSGYKVSACTDKKFKESSKLVIETYSKEILSGCYQGKLDCDGTIIEFQALFSGPKPVPIWLTTD